LLDDRAAPSWAPGFKCGDCRSEVASTRYPDK